MAKQTQEVPSWIEPTLFEQVLHEALGNFSEIVEFKAVRALPPGENYATVMIKIEMRVRLQNGAITSPSFMLKVAHNNAFYQKEITKWSLFSTEGGMYEEIVPDLEQLYAATGLIVKFGPKSYKLPTQREYILLENLAQKGFRNVPRQNCLDMEHCKAVLKKLAQWHAASAVRFERKGPYDYDYCKGIFIESGRAALDTMLKSSFKHFLKSASCLANSGEYLRELEGLEDQIIDLFYHPTGIDENEFKVLNHGDCWSNNIMFQYDESGKLLETYFVDLQVPNYGSPARDLWYFILTSAQLAIKVHQFDYMIKYYYDHLIQYLKLLEYRKPLPKLRELQKSLLQHSKWGIFAVLLTLAAVLCDPTDKASVENLFDDGEDGEKFKEMMYSNAHFMKHLEVILPFLCYRGAFDL